MRLGLGPDYGGRAAKGAMRLRPVRDIVHVDGRVYVPIWKLLSWFNFERRGKWVVSTISRKLEEMGLETQPDFADLGHGIYELVEIRRDQSTS